jgi:zinc transporter ZupT
VEGFMEKTASDIKLKDTEHGEAHGSQAAFMIWLGILIDGFPESLVIGILVRELSPQPPLAFVAGVFLANLPESMSSSGSMKAAGLSILRINALWGSIVFVTTIGAALGAVLFDGGSSNVNLVAAVEGVAAGAMLTMIAQTMMPEAFEQGGDVVGLACLAGFLAALLVKLLGS